MAFNLGRNPSGPSGPNVLDLRMRAKQTAKRLAARGAGNEVVAKENTLEPLYENGFTATATTKQLMVDTERTARQKLKRDEVRPLHSASKPGAVPTPF
ncbi:hypothetical protein [Dyella mobilis]|uniref:Uncharacterized protein n=1 Tax=Dyella mobilis TaxID=1849582 RepID=A0ABS2KJJ0_9GAMM|nr:hypothetical protein [Dyella mobilis]MBM7131249.1 hypothetical protein [Dyella mobilis]GLQ98814.1 hypothetical protein GCM10007863_32340 [Dyella mobilis]